MGVSSGSLGRAAVNPYKHATSNESFAGGGGKKGGNAPTPPDYIGAAQEQGRQNILLAQTNARLNNPNINNPLGQRTVQYGNKYDPAAFESAFAKEKSDLDAAHASQYGMGIYDAQVNPADRDRVFAEARERAMKSVNAGDQNTPTITDTLNPQAQQIFDTMQNTALTGMGRVEESFNRPFSFGGADELQSRAEQAYLSRMEPQFQRDEEALRSRLAAQGIDPYGEAANREHQRLGQTRNDARTQAVLNAYGMRPQMLQEELAIRNQPLNEVMALMSGSQTQVPQFQNYAGTQIQPAPYFEGVQNQGLADQGLYNIQQQRQTSGLNGVLGLGTAAAMFF